MAQHETMRGSWTGGEAIDRVFSAAGLPVPPVPPSLAWALKPLDNWLWGTEAPAAPLPLFDVHVENVLIDWDRDRLLIGHDGHGTGSWALSYVLKLGSLALLVQRPWGGLSEDAAAETAAIAETFAQIEAILAAPRTGKVMIVIDSLHTRLIGDGLSDGEIHLRETPEPLSDACVSLSVQPVAAPVSPPSHTLIRA
ncbi:MAG: hypothetical protein AAF713_02785 [Pseudomonadota bacterium]